MQEGKKAADQPEPIWGDLSIHFLTVIPFGERWTLKALHHDGSISRAGTFATRMEALEAAERIAEPIGVEVIR
jgi:hypothetical protein